MLTILFIALAAVIGIVVGAYSHKWLAKVTGAPANLSVGNAPEAAAALVAHGESAAAQAISSVADAAMRKIKS